MNAKPMTVTAAARKVGKLAKLGVKASIVPSSSGYRIELQSGAAKKKRAKKAVRKAAKKVAKRAVKKRKAPVKKKAAKKRQRVTRKAAPKKKKKAARRR